MTDSYDMFPEEMIKYYSDGECERKIPTEEEIDCFFEMIGNPSFADIPELADFDTVDEWWYEGGYDGMWMKLAMTKFLEDGTSMQLRTSWGGDEPSYYFMTAYSTDGEKIDELRYGKPDGTRAWIAKRYEEAMNPRLF